MEKIPNKAKSSKEMIKLQEFKDDFLTSLHSFRLSIESERLNVITFFIEY